MVKLLVMEGLPAELMRVLPPLSTVAPVYCLSEAASVKRPSPVLVSPPEPVMVPAVEIVIAPAEELAEVLAMVMTTSSLKTHGTCMMLLPVPAAEGTLIVAGP